MASVCKICAGPIEPLDQHLHCVACLGLAHAEAALDESDCGLCADLPVRVLRARRDVVRGLFGVGLTAASVPLVSPPSPGGGSAVLPCRRTQRSPHSPISFPEDCFRPPSNIEGFVAFGHEEGDEAMSISASEKDGWAGSEPEQLGSSEPSGLQEELMRVLSKAVQELELTWNPPEEPVRSKLDSWYFRSTRKADARTSVPFFPDVHEQLVKTWSAPQSARVHSNTQAMFSHVDGAEAHGYVRSPPVEETVAAHLCPAAAKSLGPDISLPSKPCRTTAHLANKAYASDGEAASALHAMAVLQVFQAKLLQTAEGGVLTPEATKDLRAATDFALMATKRAAQSVGKAMGFMVVLQRHLWLNLADLKDADRKVLLNAPISPSGLFGDAVETITERFAETQKRAKAMSHVMPRRAPQQQTARSRSSSAHGSAQRRDFPRPAQAGATATAPRQEPDVRRKVWGSGRKRQGQRRSPRRDSRPPPAAKPSSWRSEGGRRAREQPGAQAPKVQLPKCVCVECPFNKNAYFLTKRAFSSSLNKCGSPCPASVQCRSASNTGYSRAPNDRAAKAAASVHKRVEGYSGNLALATQRDRAGVYSSIQTQTTPFQWRGAVSNIASKCPGSEARDWLSARERSSRASPSTRAGERVLQPLLRGTQEGRGASPNFGSQTHQQSALRTSVQDGNAEADPGADSPRGLVCIRGFEGRVLSHSDSAASQTVSEVCFREHSVPILCSPVRAGFGPAHIFKVCGCSTFPPQSGRDAHPELSGRLADFSSVPGHATQPYRLAAYSPGVPRAMCEQAKEHSRPESVHSVFGSLHRLPRNESPPLARARGGHFVLPTPFQRRQLCSFERISETTGTHGVSVGSVSSGLITHATTAAVAENSSPLDGMDLGTFEYRGHPRLHRSSGSVAQPEFLQPGSPPGVGNLTRGGHNGRIDARLGSGVRGDASFGAVVRASDPVAHKPIGIGSSLFSSEGVSSTTGTAACTDSHRQHVCSRVHKSPGRRPFEGVVQAGSDVTAMGGFSPSIHQSNAHPRSFESRGRHAFKEENSSRGMEVTPRVSSDDLEPLRGSRGGFIRYERECTLPVVLLSVPLPVGRGRAHSALADSQALCVSSDQDIASGVMQDQGGASVRHTHSSELAEPALVSGLDRAADSPPLADSGQEGHVISGGRLGVAPEPRTMEPSCVVASGLSGELDALQARVVGTLTEARAPSTRRLYALKWGVFVKWCHQAHIDPVVCTVLDVLSFLQYRLDSGSLPSTLKVYVAAIASFRSPQGGQSIGRDPMVVSFLKGARRLHPPRPPSVPPWDLEVVLRALSQPPFEPLSSVGLKELSLKTALLLALASAKRIGDLHAFSVDSDCIRFGPGDCSVTLRPRMGYVPKSLSTPFKIQTVSLSALSSESAASSEADAQTSVCPVRALRIYIDRSASFRQSNQLFVCYGGCARGRAVSKQRLSHWIVDAITAAYTNQGLECPLHIRGHSTRAMASSWAWSRGMSIQDICVAAGWSSENTFARFYRLDVQSFASQVLSVSGWCMFTTLFALHTLTNTVVLPCAQCRFLYLCCFI